MDKGTVVELTITDMTDDGKGIGHIDGLTVFVDGSIPGDTVRGKIVQDKKRYAVAELEEILTPSPNREEAVCPYFGRCGGCSLQSMKYEAQLAMKKEHVENKLTRIGGLEHPLVRDVVVAGEEPDLHYRNKATFAVYDGPAGPAVGFRERGSSRVVDIDDCMLQKEPVMAVADAIRHLIERHKITVYKEPKRYVQGRNQKPPKQSNTAKLREVTVKACEGTGEIMVVLTVTGKQLPNAEDIVYAMDDAIDEVSEEYALESVILEVKKGDIHDFAKDYIPLAGKRTINDRIQVAGGIWSSRSPGPHSIR